MPAHPEPRQDVYALDEPGVPAILLQPRAFVVTGLPYRPGERRATRTARLGRDTFLTIHLQATHPEHDLPYGADRSLLAWITTRAYRTGTVTFAAIRDYLKAFHIDPGGRAYRRFQQAFQRIAHMAVRIEIREDGQRSEQHLRLLPDPDTPVPRLEAGTAIALEGPLLRPARYGFRLHPELHQELREHPVPISLPVLRLFHHAPRAWDFTQLLLYRSFAARRRSVIPWGALLGQLGCQDQDPHRLKHRLQRILVWIRHLYPDCPAAFLPGLRGLEVHPWQAPSQPARLPVAEPVYGSVSPARPRRRIHANDSPSGGPTRREATHREKAPAERRKRRRKGDSAGRPPRTLPPPRPSRTPPPRRRPSPPPPELPFDLPTTLQDAGRNRTGEFRSLDEIFKSFRGPP